MFLQFRERKTKLTKISNFCLFAANGKRRKVCLPWPANGKRLSTIKVSANVPIYDRNTIFDWLTKTETKVMFSEAEYFKFLE
jgi:hypothetical protein